MSKTVFILLAVLYSATSLADAENKLSCKQHEINYQQPKPNYLLSGNITCVYRGGSIADAYLAYRNHKKYGFTEKLHHTPDSLRNYSKKFTGGQGLDAWEEKVTVRVSGKKMAKVTVSGMELNWYEQVAVLKQEGNQVKIDVKFYSP